MRSGITAFDVVLVATVFALACNSEDVQVVPTKKQSVPLEVLTTRDNREYSTQGPVKERSKVSEILVTQGSESPSAVPIETESTSEREKVPEIEGASVAPSRGSLTKGEGRRAEVPKSRIKKRAPVRGSLSKEVVRRGIRKGINRVRQCFEDSFERNSCLGNRAVVRFIISPNGTVKKALIVESNTSDRVVDKCLLGAVRKFEFPAPEGGGPVTVTYPFNVSIAGDIADRPLCPSVKSR